MLELLWLILGLTGLWLGTELVIKGAINIANYYELSQLFVGIAVLAIGTDLPEIVIAVNASFQNVFQGVEASEIIIGNSIGSSFIQISFVLGTVGLFGYLTLTKRHIFEDGVMMLGSILLVILLGFDGKITRVDGGVLVIVYFIYYFSLFHREHVRKKISKRLNKSIRKNILYLLFGVFVVVFTSELVVDNAIIFAEKFDIRQSFVGIIIIGLGTSLPELALSLNAARKKAIGLTVGNLIGSNIFDLLVPVGVGASITEIQFETSLVRFDLPFLFLLSFVVLFFFHKKKGLQKVEAVILIGFFVLYTALKVAGI